MTDRARARELAAEGLREDDPLGWFERIYAEADAVGTPIPWADLRPNPNLEQFERARALPAPGATALVVGCGLGDDAEWIAGHGFRTVAFDIAPSAIRACGRRFPQSAVAYRVADLFRAPADWSGRFDLVFEAYTLQVLPARLRADAVARIAGFVAPGGAVLVVARRREPSEPEGEMPWPLTRDELAAFEREGLRASAFEEYWDDDRPPVRRVRAVFERPRGGSPESTAPGRA